ncbi:hypothetical protein FOA22_03290 [Heyndrickxia oleronia]|uniref:hypothetical protein n=1 Tax=Heyndrickxia oleronia TaxID=38875 RepID=UPI000717150E
MKKGLTLGEILKLASENGFNEQKEKLKLVLIEKFKDKASNLINIVDNIKSSDYINYPHYYPLSDELLTKIMDATTLDIANYEVFMVLNEQKKQDLERVKMFYRQSQNSIRMASYQLNCFKKSLELLEPNDKELINMKSEIKSNLEYFYELYKNIN